MLNIAGAILAGGSSSRMGADKALLRMEGQTLLMRAQNLLRAAGLQDIYISRADEIADQFSGYGPLSGVHAILSAVMTRHDYIIFVPVDMPLLEPFLIRRLILSTDRAALLSFEQYILPFRLSSEARWLEVIERMLKNKENISLKALKQHMAFSRLKVEPAVFSCFTNINTQQQWRKLIEKEGV